VFVFIRFFILIIFIEIKSFKKKSLDCNFPWMDRTVFQLAPVCLFSGSFESLFVATASLKFSWLFLVFVLRLFFRFYLDLLELLFVC
jgi:hypothetical protein